MTVSNAGASDNLKVRTFNKLMAKLKVKFPEFPHDALPRPLGAM